jgi:uncharacterized protein (TIGR02246 family)
VFAALAEGIGETKIEGPSEVLELQVLGDWAFMRNRIEIILTSPNGNRTRRSGYTLTLLRKETDGQWRLARDANLVTTC